MPIPKEKLNQIFSDPEFLALGDSEKESLFYALDTNEPVVKVAQKPQEKMTMGVPQSLLDARRGDINQTLLGVGNAATFQIPRTVANLTAKMAYGKNTPEVIPSGNLGGQIIGVMTPGGLGSRFAQLATSGIKGAGVLPSVSRMAGAGAIESQAMDYKDLPSRAMGAAGGALLGGGIAAVSKVPFGKMAAKVKESFTAGKRLEGVANEMAKVDGQLDELKNITRKDVEANLTSSAVRKAEENKVILDKMGDKLTSTYGKAQDVIESRITAKATQNDVVGIIDEALSELDTPALQGTGVHKALSGLKSKYAPEEGIIQLDPKQFTLNELKAFKNSVLGKFTPGRSEENLAKAIFRSKYGKFLEQYAPEMIELNGEFSGHINSFKQASRLFQVADEKLLARGAKALEAIAKANPKNPAYLDNLNILKSLEKSSGRFSGAGKGSLTGNFSKQLDEIRRVDNEILGLTKKKYLLENETSRLKELRTLKNQIVVSIGSALGVGGATAIGVKLAN